MRYLGLLSAYHHVNSICSHSSPVILSTPRGPNELSSPVLSSWSAVQIKRKERLIGSHQELVGLTMRERLVLGDDPLQPRTDRFAHLSRGRCPSQVWCPYLPCSHHLLDSLHQRGRCLLLTEMVEQELPRPDRSDGVGDALPRNVRGGAANGLKEARVAPLRVAVRTGCQPSASGDGSAQVGENIA